MALQNSYRFARQYLSVFRSWVLLVISLSSSTFQCASLPFLDLANLLLTFLLSEIIFLCTSFISITASLSSFTQWRGVVCLSSCIYWHFYCDNKDNNMWAFSGKLRKREHQIILISTEMNNTLTIGIAYKQHAKSRTRFG